MSDADDADALIRVRDAVLADLETIVELNVRMAAETERLRLDTATVRDGVRAVLEDGAKGTFYVAEVPAVDGSRGARPVIAGQLLVTHEWSDWRNAMFLWIQSVYVRSEYRRRGVFRALYRHVAARAAAPGHCGLRLYVHDHNDAAAATYLRLGMVSPGYRVLETPDGLRDDERMSTDAERALD